MLTIGVIGNGFVGKATHLLKNSNNIFYVYDINPKLCIPIGMTLETLCESCDIIFVSVPTPMNNDGSCHLNILESVISDISSNLNEKLIVNRCTVPPGTSDKLNCYFMPEFLTEKNFENDFVSNPQWIFGLKGTSQDDYFIRVITKLFNDAYSKNKIMSNNLAFVKNKEAEMIKLFRNNFLATKISFCNEIAEFCKKTDINYEKVRELATLDDRISSSHTHVPGHDGKYGYGGTCFPKDSNNLLNLMNENRINSYIIKATVERNELVDRREHDWETDKGRAIVN
tara:strand:- start:122 stop:973 length:852 start_codon:yes stop_codon:yes gene_type:complete